MMPPGMAPLRLFRTIAHNPRVLEKIRASNLLDRGSLDRRDREIVILRTTARCGCEYEWGVHVAFFSAKVGLGRRRDRGDRPRRTRSRGLVRARARVDPAGRRAARHVGSRTRCGPNCAATSATSSSSSWSCSRASTTRSRSS
jgi:alkylhydroperoxidase family enzyme